MLPYIERRYHRSAQYGGHDIHENWELWRAAREELNQCIAKQHFTIDQQTRKSLQHEALAKLQQYENPRDYAYHVGGLYKRAMMYLLRETVLGAMAPMFDSARHTNLRRELLLQEDTQQFLQDHAGISLTRHTLGAYEIDGNPDGKYPPQALVVAPDNTIRAAVYATSSKAPSQYGKFWQSVTFLNDRLKANRLSVINNVMFITPAFTRAERKVLLREDYAVMPSSVTEAQMHTFATKLLKPIIPNLQSFI